MKKSVEIENIVVTGCISEKENGFYIEIGFTFKSGNAETTETTEPETAETTESETAEATETETKRKRKPITTDIDMIKDFAEETGQTKSLLNTAYGITAESVTPTPTDHPYEIHFGEKYSDPMNEKWEIINKNTIHDIMKIFKCVQGKCRERIVVDGDHLNDILFDIYKYLMINDLLADKKPKKIHYDFRHMYPNNCISLPESTHFTIIYNRGFFYIDLNSIKRGFCPNRKTMNFFVEGEKNG